MSAAPTARQCAAPQPRRLLAVEHVGQEFPDDGGQANRVLDDITFGVGPARDDLHPRALRLRQVHHPARDLRACTTGARPCRPRARCASAARWCDGPAGRRADRVPAPGAQGLARRARERRCCPSARRCGASACRRDERSQRVEEMLEAVGLTAAARLYPAPALGRHAAAGVAGGAAGAAAEHPVPRRAVLGPRSRRPASRCRTWCCSCGRSSPAWRCS